MRMFKQNGLGPKDGGMRLADIILTSELGADVDFFRLKGIPWEETCTGVLASACSPTCQRSPIGQ